MSQRLNYLAASPRPLQLLIEQENILNQQFSESDRLAIEIWELVKLRVSQLNQCAYCLDMHSKDAFELGESAQRMIALSAWRDSPLYTEQERLALEWAELVSVASDISDDLYQRAVTVFGEQGLVDLTIACNAINSWNRISKAFKPEVGSYQPAK